MRFFKKSDIHRRKKYMPSMERRQVIESIVDGIIAQNGLGVPGFDLTKFLTKEYGFMIGSQALDKNTTGILLIDDDKYVPDTDTHRLISINRDLGVEDERIYNLKKRFIVAHEFAHFILHKKDHTQFAHRDTDKKNTPEEREADYFARCLLMPRKLISDVLNVEGIKEQKLCDKAGMVSRLFSVTLTKAKMRIEELGLS